MIYVGRRASKEGWVSFESDPHLRKTKANVYERCVPCLERLRNQLMEGRREVELVEALHCWKVTAVLRDVEECLRLLQLYSERYPDHYVWGKFGTGRPQAPTRVVVFHAESEAERDLLLERVRRCAREIRPDVPVFVSRACANVYAELLGDWREWGPVTPIRRPEKVPELIQRLNRMLYYTGS